jgi:CRISPR-associated Csx2 family protein
MARLFLSFLGTNNYKSCVYYQGEPPDPGNRLPVRFVQEATVGRFCKEWGPADRIILFTTCEAYRKNWVDGGHPTQPGEPGVLLEGLKTRLDKMSLGVPFQNTLIPDGSSEAEIWEIFRIVIDSIREEDEVVFDITHAFRSIPMLAIVILSYAKVIKRIRIGGIYYGAFEVLGNPRDVDPIPEPERLVPILDLTPISDLLEWAVAVDRFINAGDPQKVGELTREGVRPILKNSRGTDKAADTMRKIAGSLTTFCAVMSTCRGRKISESAERLVSQLAELERTDLLPPFKPLFEIIKDKMKPFIGEPVHDGVQAARWCLNHGLIQQGFTILNEVLVSHVLNRTFGETFEFGARWLPAQADAIMAKGLTSCCDQWEEPARSNREMTLKLVSFFSDNKPVHETLRQIKNYRNDIDHAGLRENAIGENKFTPALKTLIENVENAL